MKRTSVFFTKLILIVLFVGLFAPFALVAQGEHQRDQQDAESFTFISSPDFTNNDVAYPEPRWDSALNYILNAWSGENADFLLVAGDLVWGRWKSKKRIRNQAKKYYGGWVKRMKKHGIKFYVAVGDHELGDNPWSKKKRKLLPAFHDVFAKYFDMPRNGPSHMKGLAYYVRHKNVLLVTVNVFELISKNGKEQIRYGVTGKQLQWLETVFKQNQDVNHIIVQGHIPILGPIPRGGPSSRLMLKRGKKSKLWKLMTKYGTDLYLAGEHHVIDIKNADGIVQVTHGTALGFFESTNYLKARVTPDVLSLKLKKLPVNVKGDHRGNRTLSIPEKHKEKGFQTVGRLVIDKNGEEKKFKTASGVFKSIDRK